MDYELETVNYSGHTFADFYPRRDPATGPGWYVFGRNTVKYGVLADGTGAYVMLCARPAVTARKHRYYNCDVRRGWYTKREAQQIVDSLNRKGE
jgi:hypothetical protein